MIGKDWTYKGISQGISAITIILVLTACGVRQDKLDITTPSTATTEQLLAWLEASGNYINSKEAPSLINAREVYALREKNIHIIDLRDDASYAEAHIEHAINLQPGAVLDYFQHAIDPASFSHIVFVCHDVSISGHVASVLRLLGYDNVYALRFGMSSWSRRFAERHWFPPISNQLVGKLDTTGYPKPPAGALPALSAVSTSGYDIALERAREILQLEPEAYILTIDQFLENPEDYYTICYWPVGSYYSNGHLRGAVQYDPRNSLDRNTDLNTLPLDKPVVTYCHAGHQSAFVTAYLRLLGYDARSLKYGANAFIHELMVKTEPIPTRSFTEDLIQDLPLVEGEKVTQAVREARRKDEETRDLSGCL